VRYRAAQTQTITLANPGKVFVHFRFMPEEHLRRFSEASHGITPVAGVL